MINEILQHIPEDAKRLRYHEPFLGAGSLFFALRPRHASLSDANHHVIDCHRFVRDCPELIYRSIRRYAKSTSERYYYEVREAYNRGSASPAQAARFIYLNKTCFNGIFRVNRAGKFNVPYGWKEPPSLPSLELLRSTSSALKHASLKVQRFEDATSAARPGDFVYLDPPYPPLNGTAYFTHYTENRFSIADHRRVAEEAQRLDRNGCRVLISNADVPLVRELYRGFCVLQLPAVRYISCKRVKHRVNELLIANYRMALSR